MQNTAKQNYPGSAASYNTQSENETGLFNNAPELGMLKTDNLLSRYPLIG